MQNGVMIHVNALREQLLHQQVRHKPSGHIGRLVELTIHRDPTDIIAEIDDDEGGIYLRELRDLELLSPPSA